MERIEKKQDRLLKLLEKLEIKFKKRYTYRQQDQMQPAISVSNYPVIAIVFDAVENELSRGEESIIVSAIQMQIQKAYPGISIAEHAELDVIYEKLNLALSPISDNRIHPELLSADLIIILKTYESFFKTNLYIKLMEMETGKSYQLPVLEIKKGRIASQDLIGDILEFIEKNYPDMEKD